MIKTQFFLFGVEVSALIAELHFVNWILALEQEHNPIALNAVNGQRCALDCSHAFHSALTAAIQSDAVIAASIDAAITASGIFIKDTWVV